MTTTSNLSTSRVFSPLVLYHDGDTSPLTMSLKTNSRRLMIDEHKTKTIDRLQYDAHLWTTPSDAPKDTQRPSLDTTGKQTLDVSPSTSTSSSSSTSSDSSWTSRSSCDSIATIDSPPRTMEPMIYSSTPPLTRELSPVQSAVCSMPPNTIADHHQMQQQQKQPVKDAAKKRRRGNLPREVTEFLKHWLIQHKAHPYPSEKEKGDLACRTGLTVNQISNWFINARRRILQPMLDSEQIIRSQWMSYPEIASIEARKIRQLSLYAQQDFSIQRSQLPNLNFFGQY
ncbi:Homeodomain-like DNA binding domain-containing transcription factor [Phycomyces blakesleeanus]|uniref:Homeodomain-like DNA binding domain-containing transcription factor n=2 Tax=Phycomyces blakesleeanus TaxID=4837 RepID=A0A163BDZ9_PHYB8|nr:Homeodomain-like DNA binding domain-containing transcription factor [Phycomyces blakesleeanus NRRL 1555(-)]OAD80971.1 Homeodomain-like DNA binding domain-containing transcription factor [Phycomyces blakesleeanus NRRL 1555(-)]|eukprot:XP_018299011.1 Homeodomain-like DNA binding domain-containing transcription factor [Phycomyces blakesleeanus NRRL 1555(-)]